MPCTANSINFKFSTRIIFPEVRACSQKAFSRPTTFGAEVATALPHAYWRACMPAWSQQRTQRRCRHDFVRGGDDGKSDLAICFVSSLKQAIRASELKALLDDTKLTQCRTLRRVGGDIFLTTEDQSQNVANTKKWRHEVRCQIYLALYEPEIYCRPFSF